MEELGELQAEMDERVGQVCRTPLPMLAVLAAEPPAPHSPFMRPTIILTKHSLLCCLRLMANAFPMHWCARCSTVQLEAERDGLEEQLAELDGVPEEVSRSMESNPSAPAPDGNYP